MIIYLKIVWLFIYLKCLFFSQFMRSSEVVMNGCIEGQLLNLFRLWLEAVWELVMLYLWKLVYEKKRFKKLDQNTNNLYKMYWCWRKKWSSESGHLKIHYRPEINPLPVKIATLSIKTTMRLRSIQDVLSISFILYILRRSALSPKSKQKWMGISF